MPAGTTPQATARADGCLPGQGWATEPLQQHKGHAGGGAGQGLQTRTWVWDTTIHLPSHAAGSMCDCKESGSHDHSFKFIEISRSRAKRPSLRPGCGPSHLQDNSCKLLQPPGLPGLWKEGCIGQRENTSVVCKAWSWSGVATDLLGDHEQAFTLSSRGASGSGQCMEGWQGLALRRQSPGAVVGTPIFPQARGLPELSIHPESRCPHLGTLALLRGGAEPWAPTVRASWICSTGKTAWLNWL